MKKRNLCMATMLILLLATFGLGSCTSDEPEDQVPVAPRCSIGMTSMSFVTSSKTSDFFNTYDLKLLTATTNSKTLPPASFTKNVADSKVLFKSYVDGVQVIADSLAKADYTRVYGWAMYRLTVDNVAVDSAKVMVDYSAK